MPQSSVMCDWEVRGSNTIASLRRIEVLSRKETSLVFLCSQVFLISSPPNKISLYHPRAIVEISVQTEFKIKDFILILWCMLHVFPDKHNKYMGEIESNQ